MPTDSIRFPTLAIKTIVVHTVTYFIMGLLASTIFNYAEMFSSETLACYMRPTTDRMVMAGPLFQPIRGLIFALAFYPLREVFFGRRNGWLIMWGVLVALGILSTFGATPGSLEGMVYTQVPIQRQLAGLPEVIVQALLLSGGVYYWVTHPQKRWLNWALGVAVFLVLSLPVLGLLLG